MTAPDNNHDNTDAKKNSSWLPMVTIAVIAIAAGVFAGTRGSGPISSAASDTQALEVVQNKLVSTTIFPDDFKTVPPFSLLTANNQPITESALDGQWTVLFFGFTHCPDICPNTLNEMNGVVSELANGNTTVPQVMFITVDPVRDTVEKMTEYVNYFNTDFVGVSGDLTDITQLTRKLGIVASYTADTNGSDNYSVDHTASMLLIDPQLRVRAKLTPPHKMDTLVADLKTLITHYN